MIKLEVSPDTGLLELWEFHPTPGMSPIKIDDSFVSGTFYKKGLVCEGHGLEIGKLLRIPTNRFKLVEYVDTAFDKKTINMRTPVYKYTYGKN